MKNNLKIGLFGINSSSGIAMTMDKDRWSANWDDILKAVKICDQNGLDFIFSVQRWLGFGGKTDPASLTYDSLSFCSAISSITSNIELVATIHTPLFHPTHIARALSSIDQFSKGRINLNVVCGWNKKEFQMFGINEINKDDLYQQGEIWIKILKNIFNKQIKNYSNKYFNCKYPISSPLLYNRKKINIFSAAFSPAGREFALKNCDTIITMFSSISSLKKQIKNIKKLAKQKYKKKIKIYALAHVMTERSSRYAKMRYNDYSVNKADNLAVTNFINLLNPTKKNVFNKNDPILRQKIAAGIGSYPLVGSYSEVLNEIKEIEKTGLDGLAISFLNYKEELPLFFKNIFSKLRN